MSMKTHSEQFGFDLGRVLSAVVPISAHIPEEAMSASLLGTERSGHGVVIQDDGLIVTIGYLIAEAESVWIKTGAQTIAPGYVVGYDYETGFGLLKPVQPIYRPRIPLGRAADLKIGDPVFVAGSGGPGDVVEAQVVAKQEFAGRWEYLLDEAIYTAPAHKDWAGAAMLDRKGRLCGIGSLLVHDGKSSETEASANLFVPIDILVPIIGEMCEFGRQLKPPHPWLGLLIHDADEELLVAGVYRKCPGDLAGLKPGDVILEIDGDPAGHLAEFFRKVWSLGPAGVAVPLTVLRDEETHKITVHSSDRATYASKGTIN
ncbi:MAG: serine protease [Gammaproteobacteria bacterium]|nr:serine protease [Gammaproteobacteria bacterium]